MNLPWVWCRPCVSQVEAEALGTVCSCTQKIHSSYNEAMSADFNTLHVNQEGIRHRATIRVGQENCLKVFTRDSLTLGASPLPLHQ